MKAARQAMEGTGRSPQRLAWVLADEGLSLQAVISGAGSVLGDTAIIGFSTTADLRHMPEVGGGAAARR
jgi:hypothetical protein